MLTQVRSLPVHASAEHVARTLVTHDSRAGTGPPGHDRRSRSNVARRLAEIMGCAFGGHYDPLATYEHPLYFVPHDALLAREAEALGIADPRHLFGGVVPHAFIATKAITHPLVAPDATAPEGWSHAFADYAADTVLRGYTTFAPGDAQRAGALLLPAGPVRIKCVSGIGGTQQWVADSVDALDAAIAGIGREEFRDSGVTVEEHLDAGTTYSVGVVDCCGMTIAYCGTQQTTRNRRGEEVYGGSTLDVVRGGFAALLDRDLPPDRRAAVELAQGYDSAAFAAYPEAFASRRNYDVLFGQDGRSRPRAGVLEQSWRIGGASGAEVIALAAFQRDPSRQRVRCATVEVYGDACEVPAGAFVYYRGVDRRVGPLTKYAVELDGEDG